WLPWTDLPVLQWAEDNTAVPEAVLRWLVVEASRGHEAHLSSEVRAGFDLLDPASRAALAVGVLELWLGSEPSGSAKLAGLGSFSAAIGGSERIVSRIDSVIWRDAKTRTPRARALVRLLAAIDQPAALRALLNLRATMRTASVRKEAAEALEELAQARGWTAADLDDWMLPHLGFDAEATTRVGEPPRAMRLDPNSLNLEWLDGPGDEAERKHLQKQLRAAWKSQTRRFEEAMVGGRSWTVMDWRERFIEHPWATWLCRRLIWRHEGDAGAAASFRPTQDGAIDADGTSIELPSAGRVQLAHRLLLEDRVADAWSRQIANRSFAPLFDQLRPAHRLGTQLEGVRMVELPSAEWIDVNFAKAQRVLRQRGYTRGRSYDDGRLFRFVKRFAELDLAAHLEVCELGEASTRSLEIRGFCFSRASARVSTEFDVPRLRFAKIPALLYSETRQDFDDLLALPRAR
ncbi:MAG: DUF4132 domain-containing protein, partial [Acidobacteriota bacterium]